MKLLSRTLLGFFLCNLFLNSVGAQTSSCSDIRSYLSLGSKDGHSKKEVTSLQKFLYPKYLHVSPSGYFGSATVVAVKAFQKANGIEPNGYVGPRTRAKINSLCDFSFSENIQSTLGVQTISPTSTASTSLLLQYSSSLSSSLLKVLIPQEGTVAVPGKPFKVKILYPEKGAEYLVSLGDVLGNSLMKIGTISVPIDSTLDSQESTFVLPPTLPPKESAYRVIVMRTSCSVTPCQVMQLYTDNGVAPSAPTAIGPLFNVRPDTSSIETPFIKNISSPGLSNFQIAHSGIATITGDHLVGPPSINGVRYINPVDVYIGGIKVNVLNSSDKLISFAVPERLPIGNTGVVVSFMSLSGEIYSSKEMSVKVIKLGTSDIVPNPHMSIGLDTDNMLQVLRTNVGKILYRHLDDGCPNGPGLCGFTYVGTHTVSQAPDVPTACNLIQGTFTWVDGSVSQADNFKQIPQEYAGCKYTFTYQVTNQLGVSRSVENILTVLP